MTNELESGAQGAVDAQDDIITEQTAGTFTEEEAPETQEAPEDNAEGDDSSEKRSDGPKKKSGWHRKIDRLTRDFSELENRYRQTEAELEKYRSGTQQKPQTVSDAPVKPKQADFQTWEDYENAKDEYFERLTDWKADQKVKSAFESQTKQTQEQRAALEFQKRVETYGEKARELAKTETDFFDKVAEFEASGLVTPALETAIMESDIGPRIAHYLASNLDEAEKLQGLGVVALNRAIGRIEAKLENQPVKAAVKQTQAAPPINPVKAKASATTKNPADMTQEEYEIWRYANRA